MFGYKAVKTAKALKEMIKTANKLLMESYKTGEKEMGYEYANTADVLGCLAINMSENLSDVDMNEEDYNTSVAIIKSARVRKNEIKNTGFKPRVW